MLPETTPLPIRVSTLRHNVVLIEVCNAYDIKLHEHNHASHAMICLLYMASMFFAMPTCIEEGSAWLNPCCDLPSSHAFHVFSYAQGGKSMVKDRSKVIPITCEEEPTSILIFFPKTLRVI